MINIKKEKLTHYDCDKPWLSRSGTDSEIWVTIEDNTLEIAVTLDWDGYRDQLEITDIHERYTDCDGIEISSEHIDIEHLVDEIFSKYSIYGKAEAAMESDYHADHA